MIGQLRGILLEKHPPHLVIDLNGIGYEVDAPMSTFYHLPDIGQQVTLFTHFVVREDAQCLFGFATREERLLFRTLLRVNGVGPRLGLTILSSIDVDTFVNCIANDDSTSLTRVPGVGKKTAERLIIEMRDKLGGWQQQASTNPLIIPNSARTQVLQDAIAALISLGYKPQDANKVISKLDDNEMNSENMIRLALREMIG